NLYKNLDYKGLFVRTFYRTEFITNLYLPKFMGGNDGKLIFKARNWIEKQGKNKLIFSFYNNVVHSNWDESLKN
ncbi:unnamed protein product, partial [marine sediment metagenome]